MRSASPGHRCIESVPFSGPSNNGSRVLSSNVTCRRRLAPSAQPNEHWPSAACTKNAFRTALLPLFTPLCWMKASIIVYRLLEAEGESGERRDQLTHPAYHKHELLATGPNQLWSWDITKLMGPVKWTCFYLYVIMDVFSSRYVVGWMIAPHESAELAKRLIGDTCKKQDIAEHQLTIHADRGSSMTSQPVAFLLADLGVTKTHSRPHVSDDNPYSESQFKTLTYRPDFPDCFGSIQDSRSHCQSFFAWYNDEHRHSGLGLLTPAMIHHGQAEIILAQRQDVLTAAFLAHPQPFVKASPGAIARSTGGVDQQAERLIAKYSLNSAFECLKTVDIFRHARSECRGVCCALTQ